MDRGSVLALSSVIVGWLLMMLGFWIAGGIANWLTARPRVPILEALKLLMGMAVLVGLLVLWFEAVEKAALQIKGARRPR